MATDTPTKSPQIPNEASLFDLMKPYFGWIIGLALLTVGGNALNLTIPKIISGAIDSYAKGNFVIMNVVIEFFIVACGILVLTYLQAIVQTYTSERVARDLRTDLAAKISLQDNAFIQRITPSRLLTNLTSDVNSIKTFVAQAIASLISSAFLILGASVLLLLIDWKLALAVLAVLPVISVTFYAVLARVRKLFTRQQEAIDWLNKVINESIVVLR
jgi:ATP-binding cassette subfamily B protein